MMGSPESNPLLDWGELEPGRYVSFTLDTPFHPHPYSTPIRIAVLDSPLSASSSAPPITTAALLVPKHRESDWIFSTHSGHHQLLLASPPPLFSRLVLVGDQPSASSPSPYTRPSDVDHQSLEDFYHKLLPLLHALCPKDSSATEFPEIPFIFYEDDVVRSVPIEILSGSVVGDLLVEDVDLLLDGSHSPEPRRRMRFKRMPNLVQAQVKLVEGEPDLSSLVQPYLPAMTAGLAAVARSLDGIKTRPRVLCLGVGAGAFLMFLDSQLGFSVVGVEADPIVIEVAKRHFRLVEGENVEIVISDAFEFVKNFAQSVRKRDAFDVIMVDLDAADAMDSVSAPPLKFTEQSFLKAAKLALNKHGVLIINVIPQDQSFYSRFIDALRGIFFEIYELDVGDEENYVVLATISQVDSDTNTTGALWIEKLKVVVGTKLLDSIRKI